jgi:hypothetical protein
MSARRPADATAPSPAQWALARMLDAAFDDPEVAQRCVELALKSASRITIPDGVEELLAFGREHLVPVLSDELGPRIVAMLFEDLVTDLRKLRKSEIRFAPVPRAFRRSSTVPRLTLSPASEVPSSRPSLTTIQSPAPRDSLPAGRPVVALVEGDRWRRAPIARQLVQNGCDVLPLDSSAAALDHLHQLRTRFPAARIVAWSNDPAASEHARTAGFEQVVELSRTVSPASVADAAKKLTV